MKIVLAQIRQIRGNIEKNIDLHKRFISLAIENEADAVFFPELSITGYEPTLANELKIGLSGKLVSDFQELSNSNQMVVGLGAPLELKKGLFISMLIFQPSRPLETYCKQQLHDDEKPYFSEGASAKILNLKDGKIGLAICYESLRESHLNQNLDLGANLYLASVAKSQKGIENACSYFPDKAKANKIPILLVNSVGYCDNFEIAGQSAIWNSEGKLIAQLPQTQEGLLIYDTTRGSAQIKLFP
ncbi:carbon-nitrogen hydrolase family protein [Pseudozobellia sp. WGM2]|uniref:carbon-nitrogen hydrolase family protein n=1 Tax=Pseudozobellia sp. WGM2 TaxID=2787625 RepID=UPI001ADF003E|nr:carbon-nitrogen hydrolase family protein [Pseudozobellia sp. WGM2]